MERSRTIVSRGLQDLARSSNWAVKRIFTGAAAGISISRSGLVGALAQEESSGSTHIAVYDLAKNDPAIALPIPLVHDKAFDDRSVLLAWSPAARHLAAFFPQENLKAIVFDIAARTQIEPPNDLGRPAAAVAWSTDGKYLGLASLPEEGSLRLWESHFDAHGRVLLGAHAVASLDLRHKPNLVGSGVAAADSAPSSGAPINHEAQDGVASPAMAFGRFAFSPNGKSLATALDFSGGWADDAVAFLTVPALEVRNIFAAQGRVTHLDWICDGQQVIVCASGQAHLLDCKEAQSTELPFEANLCACHPNLPIVCFSAQPKSSPRGRIFLAKMRGWKIFDEIPADGVADLTWSGDGSKAYAVTTQGTAYIYEPPVI